METKYRNLTTGEIEILEQNRCICNHWEEVRVVMDFSPENFYHVEFSGSVRLGRYTHEHIFAGGIKKRSGIRYAVLHNCDVGDHVLIEHIRNYIANYTIGDYSVICNTDALYTDGATTFGNGIKVNVLNETGGREVMMFDKLNAHLAYMQTCYRHRPQLISHIQKLVGDYTAQQKSEKGTIGRNTGILNTGTIKNVRIGDYAFIEGACRLEEGSINSNEADPVHIGYGVIAENFIVCSGTEIEDGVMLNRCFVGQGCYLGHTYSASDSLFFSNCHGENGEACAVFAGPYTVTHHKSTLLISGMFSFMNAGSGSNQSNHMYKLGPIHQGVLERGSKTASDSYILWPAKIGAFSLIMGRHYKNSDTSDMPFSYLIENEDESYLIPGVNLRSVGTIRDSQKFPKRDKRRDHEKLDCINFNLLSPYTVQKMFKAISILENLKQACGETSQTYTYQSCKIKSSSLKNGLRLYHLAVNKFLGNSLISRLSSVDFHSEEEIKACLKPDSLTGTGAWRDVSGVFVPASELDKLMGDIEKGRIRSIGEINTFFQMIHAAYYSLEWTWAWDRIQEYYALSIESITCEELIRIIGKWQESVVALDRMLYEDAKKEFSMSSRTGFGIDGTRMDQEIDFEQVRGNFETNSFVKTVLNHIEVKQELGDRMIKKIKNCTQGV